MDRRCVVRSPGFDCQSTFSGGMGNLYYLYYLLTRVVATDKPVAR